MVEDERKECVNEEETKIGQPKGATKKEAQDFVTRSKQAFHEASLRYSAVKVPSKRVGKGTLKKIITEVEYEFNLLSNNLKSKGIRSRIKKGRAITPNSKGPSSPLANLEELLVSIFIERAAINQLLNVSNGL